MNSNNVAVYKLKNTSTATLCGILAGESKIIVMNPQFYHEHGVDNVLKCIESGDLVAYDISSTAIEYQYAYTKIQSLWREVLNFIQKIKSSTETSEWHHLSVRLEWNLNSVDSIVSLIGEDILRTNFASLGVTRAATINKIKPIFEMMSIGQYTEAVVELDNVVLDSFYTSTRIADYKNVVAGVDSFNFIL